MATAEILPSSLQARKRLGSESRLLFMDALCTTLSLIINPILLPWIGYTSADIELIVITGLLLNAPMLWRFGVQFCYRRTPLAVARTSCWIRLQCSLGFMLYPPLSEDVDPALVAPNRGRAGSIGGLPPRSRGYSLVRNPSDETMVRPVFHIR